MTTRKESGFVVRTSDVVEDGALASSDAAVEQRVQRLRAIWKQLAMFMSGARQYGWSHPEPQRLMAQALREVSDALSDGAEALRWEVTPYAFASDGQPIWEPDRPPFDRIPFLLFADGMRSITLRAGITASELRDFAAILLRDDDDVGDDSVTAIWDRRFEHVAYVAVDAVALGEADDQEAFDDECDEIAQAALLAARMVESEEERLAPGEARAMLEAALGDATTRADVPSIDPATRDALAPAMAMPVEEWSERFRDVLADAVYEAATRRDTEGLAAVLREWTKDQVQLHRLDAAFELVTHVARSVASRVDAQRREGIESFVTALAFGPAGVRAVLHHLGAEPAATRARGPLPPGVAQGVASLLASATDGGLMDAVCATLASAPPPELRSVLLAFVRRWSTGSEALLGELLATVDASLAVDLLAVIAPSDAFAAPATLAALGAGLRNPAAEVRLAIVRSIPGPTADSLERAVQALLDDGSRDVRIAAHASIRRLRMAGVGPRLVQTAQSPAFHDLSLEDREATLASLTALNPVRAEALAVDLLGRSTVIPTASAEATRVLVANFLADARSPAALAALHEAGKWRPWNSAALRAAARSSATIVAARLEAPPGAGNGPA